MLKHIRNFFYGVFSAEGGLSSKRVVGFICALLIVEMVQAQLWAGKTVDSELLYVVTGLIATCFGMNTFLHSKSISAKTDVASDIVKQEPNPDTADDAKEILNSPKP